jgi:hypothetical protein
MYTFDVIDQTMFTGDDNNKVYVQLLDDGYPTTFYGGEGHPIYTDCLEFDTVEEAKQWVKGQSHQLVSDC